MISIENAALLSDLKWDTKYFGVTSAKAVLNRPLTFSEWTELQFKFRDYQFVSITNQNSEPVNTQLIGKNTSAFLADVNIQFRKKLTGRKEMPSNVSIYRSLERNEQIIEIADFQFSKFTEDPELAARGGSQVYHQWLINAFAKPDKLYALSKDEMGNINGFVLFSYSDNTCVIELIAVSKNETTSGIGTSLFKAVEYATLEHGYDEIKVGTQIRNMRAINFYHKVGCKQIGCHQVYHLWNI